MTATLPHRSATRLAAALAALLSAPLSTHAAGWSIDPAHSSTSFGVKHLVISTVRGQFTRTSGHLQLDEADLTRSSVEATIDAASVDTRNEMRDHHLRSADFLDVARFPTLTFRSTQVKKTGADTLAVTGDLTLHGVTRPVTLAVTLSPAVKDMQGQLRRGFSATGRLDRTAFGLTWSKAVEVGPVVGDEITLALDVEAVQDAPASATR